jgi:hypothetical protein
MKQWKSILVVMVSVVLVFMMTSCKKSSSSSDNPTGPDDTISKLYGSGSISFNTNSTVIGNYSMSGSFNPTGAGASGSGIMCYYVANSNSAWIYGYKWTSSTNWDWSIITIYRASGLGTGSYSFADNDASISIMKGATSMSGYDGTNYVLDAGTANVTSFSSTGMQGNFSGTGVGVTSDVLGLPIQLTNGSFNVTFGTATNQP